MDTMISISVIRRAGVFIAATVVVPVLTLAASGCGGHATTTAATAAAGSTTNGLQAKTSAQVIQDAAVAVRAANSIRLVLTLPKDQKASSQVVDLRIQGGARTITFLESGREQFEAIIIGKDTYVKISPAALKIPDWLSVPKHFTGRWLKISRNRLNLGGLQHWSPATVAAILANHGPLDPVVRQATLHGRKVVVVTDRENGGKLYVADTGTAYPLLIANPDGRQIECTDYGANFHITAPRNALPEP